MRSALVALAMLGFAGQILPCEGQKSAELWLVAGYTLTNSPIAGRYWCTEEGPDFDVVRYESLGPEQPQIGFYIGSHPKQLHESSRAEVKVSPLNGQSASWTSDIVGGKLRYQTIIDISHTRSRSMYVHFWLIASSVRELDELLDWARSIRFEPS